MPDQLRLLVNEEKGQFTEYDAVCVCARVRTRGCVRVCCRHSQLLRVDSTIWLRVRRLPQRAAQERMEWKIKDDSEKMAFYRENSSKFINKIKLFQHRDWQREIKPRLFSPLLSLSLSSILIPSQTLQLSFTGAFLWRIITPARIRGGTGERITGELQMLLELSSRVLWVSDWMLLIMPGFVSKCTIIQSNQGFTCLVGYHSISSELPFII